MTPARFDLVGAIMEYEAGELDGDETLELFSHLISTGDAWTLQGAYGRQAHVFIDAGFIDRDTGEIDHDAVDDYVMFGGPVPELDDDEDLELEVRRPDLVGTACECGASYVVESGFQGYGCARR